MHLPDRQFDRMQGQHGYAKQTIGVRPAVIRQPAIVRMIERMHELGVFNTAEGQADARVEERRIDAVEIHVGYALVRVEPAGFAVLVGHRVVANDTVTSAYGAERCQASAAAKSPTVDPQTLLAVLVNKQPRRAVAERLVDVVLPQIERFEDMPVGID